MHVAADLTAQEDEAATRALRAELAAQRGDPAMFDLRYSLLAVSLVFGLWSSLHYFLAGKTIRQEFRKSS